MKRVSTGLQKSYTGLVLYMPKTEYNVGSLIRTAHILGIDFIASIGSRYDQQSTDTTKATQFSIPYFKYLSFEDFNNSRPPCPLVAIELTENAILEHKFAHPRSAIYIVGAEDNGLPKEVLTKCQYAIKLHGSISMNVACAGSIVLYNRFVQLNRGDVLEKI